MSATLGSLRNRVELRRADVRDAAVVLDVLDEASAWLRVRGVKQWPERFSPELIRGSLAAGTTWLAYSGGRPAATVTLDWSDPLWGDQPAPAGYVHRLAVRRWAVGVGATLLTWARRTSAQQERAYLRLDCVAWNRALRAYYESAGFVHRGDVEISAAPGTLVSRYELRLAAPHTLPA